MVFTKSLVKTFIRKLAWRAFTWAENLNDTRMEQNGKDLFLAHLPEVEPFVFFEIGFNAGGQGDPAAHDGEVGDELGEAGALGVVRCHATRLDDCIPKRVGLRSSAGASDRSRRRTGPMSMRGLSQP